MTLWPMIACNIIATIFGMAGVVCNMTMNKGTSQSKMAILRPISLSCITIAMAILLFGLTTPFWYLI